MGQNHRTQRVASTSRPFWRTLEAIGLAPMALSLRDPNVQPARAKRQRTNNRRGLEACLACARRLQGDRRNYEVLSQDATMSMLHGQGQPARRATDGDSPSTTFDNGCIIVHESSAKRRCCRACAPLRIQVAGGPATPASTDLAVSAPRAAVPPAALALAIPPVNQAARSASPAVSSTLRAAPRQAPPPAQPPEPASKVQLQQGMAIKQEVQQQPPPGHLQPSKATTSPTYQTLRPLVLDAMDMRRLSANQLTFLLRQAEGSASWLHEAAIGEWLDPLSAGRTSRVFLSQASK